MDRQTGPIQESNRNGNGNAHAARVATERAVAEREGGRAPAWMVGVAALAGDALTAPAKLTAAAGRAVKGRIPVADLDERDPDYIRESLPRLWLLASVYFRAEVRGLGNIPEAGGVLMVGNHSGGNITPDTSVFTLAFCSYFGVERPFYQLAHNLVLSMPGLSFLRKYGTVAASHENAREALSTGAAVLVYPGGDYEVHRPVWERHRVDFGGRKGFIRLALDQDVPIVPVVSVGGQETSIFLSRGEGLAKLLRLDKAFRLKVLPISLALPWGINVGDMLGHWPLPAKIVVEALPPIHLREEFGDDPDLDEVYEHVMRLMQDTLDALASERRLPLLG
ncbi:MAG: lysophospholipid acyltransferase family protein [Solirubrobacteraceae bacterium]